MLSEIWTAKKSTAGSASTLAALGFDRAEITFGNQVADELSLSAPVTDYAGDDLWDYGDTVILYRDSVEFFRGKVYQTPRSGGAGAENHAYVIRGVWQELENLIYAQTWKSYSGGSTSDATHPRSILAYDVETESYVDSVTVLGQLISYAATAGVPVAFHSGGVSGISIAAITTAGRTVAELIRQVMRWHPDCVLYAVYGATDTTLRMARRTSASAVLLSGQGRPLSSINIRSRPDLVPGNVVLSYEASVTDDDGTRRLQIYQDAFPDANIDTQTLFAIVPARHNPQAIQSFPGAAKPHVVPIETRPLPANGANDLAAEKFWLEYSGLKSLGITTDDIALPSTTASGVRAHTTVLNPDDIEGPPSVTNPNSTPVWSPTTLADLPRVLVEGMLHDWMGVLAAPIICAVTIAVKKSTVDALDQADKDDFLRVSGAVLGNVSGAAAYLAHAQVELMGTDASTQNYSKLVSSTPASYTEPEPEDQAIPSLAANIYASRSELHWEGSWTSTEREVGAVRYLGSMLNIYHPSRAEWGTMRAMIQRERLRLDRGETVIEFGPPKQLSIQDWVEMHEAARQLEVQRSVAADSPTDQTGAEWTASYEDETNPVVDGAIGPIRNFSWRPNRLPKRRLWGFRPAAGASLQWLPVVGKLRDGDTDVTINGAATAQTLSDGDVIYLAYSGAIPTSAVTAVTWTKAASTPDEYGVSGSGDAEVMDGYNKILATIHDEDPGGDADQLATDLWIRYEVADADLLVIFSIAESPNTAGQPLAVIEFVPQ